MARQVQATSLAMRAVIQGVRMKFPAVKTLTTETLQKWLLHGDGASSLPAGVTNGNKKSRLILIDARPEVEYTVSHIADGIRADHEMVDMDQLKKLMLQKMQCDSPEDVAGFVVMYCSVGFRSSILADKLQQSLKLDSAYKDWRVFNLEGSIFKWANEDRPIVDQQGQPTNYLHPFNDLWGKMVDKERWKSTP